jgi:hypothetical protein
MIASLLVVLGFTSVGAVGQPGLVPASNYQIVQKAKQSDPHKGDNWLSVLQIRTPIIEIPLMWEFPALNLGFEIDQSSLRVVWLHKNSLLWISWKSMPAQGSGGYTTEMHLLESVTEGKAIDLLQQCFSGSGSQGAGNHQSTSVEFQATQIGESGLPRISRTAAYVDACRDFQRAVPLGVSTDGSFWRRQFRIVEKTEYAVGADSLKEVSRTSWIDLSAPPTKRVALQELADFLYVYTKTDRWTKSNEDQSAPQLERENMVKALLAVNSNIKSEQPLEGLIKIPTDHPLIEPMSPNHEENPLRKARRTGGS